MIDIEGPENSFDPEGFEVVINREFMVYENYKIKGVKHEAEVGLVGIGIMKFEKLPW